MGLGRGFWALKGPHLRLSTHFPGSQRCMHPVTHRPHLHGPLTSCQHGHLLRGSQAPRLQSPPFGELESPAWGSAGRGLARPRPGSEPERGGGGFRSSPAHPPTPTADTREQLPPPLWSWFPGWCWEPAPSPPKLGVVPLCGPDLPRPPSSRPALTSPASSPCSLLLASPKYQATPSRKPSRTSLASQGHGATGLEGLEVPKAALRTPLQSAFSLFFFSVF